MPAHFRRFAVCLIVVVGLPLAVAAQDRLPVVPVQKNDDKDRGGLGFSPAHVHIPTGSHGSGGNGSTGSPKAPTSEPTLIPPVAPKVEPWSPAPRPSAVPTGAYEPRFTPSRIPTVEPHVRIPSSSLSTVSHVPAPRTGSWVGKLGAGLAGIGGAIGAFFRGLFGRKKE